MKKRVLLLLLFLLSSAINAKVLIMTHVFNRLDFIGIHDQTFKKFLQDDYEYVVFCDTPQEEDALKVKKYCDEHAIRYVRVPQDIHTKPYLYRESDDYLEPSVRTSNAIQYSLNTLGFNHDGIVVIIDSDLFLVKNFSIESYMHDYDLAALLQSRDNDVLYLWNGLVFMDMRRLPHKKEINFNCGHVEGQPVDTGGYTHYYLKKYPDLKIKETNVTHVTGKTDNELLSVLKAQNFRTPLVAGLQRIDVPNMEFLLGDTFLHYRGGANWENKSRDFHAHKTKILRQIINVCMSYPH